MRRIHPSQWTPADGLELEPYALRIVSSQSNTLVVAGPGAGKTELLAQRASWLLLTGMCPAPRRILAISFKRDAAKNLKDRVRRRCGRELARRFDSYTYDAFAKGLVDRFRLGLPDHLRPPADYEVLTRDVKDQLDDVLRTLQPSEPFPSADDLQSLDAFRFQRILESPGLPLAATPPSTPEEYIQQQGWSALLERGGTGLVTFAMIQQMADLLLQANPALLRALRASYSHVFLDEFQDTTSAQYHLVTTAFVGSSSVLTAVGDHKQSIMGWAGARSDVFDTYAADFDAGTVPLFWNHRTAPVLTDILRSLVKRLDPADHGQMESHYVGEADGICEVWDFDSEAVEAAHVAQHVAGLVQDQGHSPREICLLVRQRTKQYMVTLLDALLNLGVKGRVEDQVQDLLAEPIWEAIRSFLRVATGRRTHGSQSECLRMVCDARVGGYDDRDQRAVRTIADETSAFAEALRQDLTVATPDKEALKQRLDAVVEFVGRDFVRLAHPRYRQDHFLAQVLSGLADGLWDSSQRSQCWFAAVQDYEGLDSVPMMTVHKSKGLEYRVVYFIGLEDSAFWNIKNQHAEEVRNFFVAFSRAREQVYFTFCHERYNGPLRSSGAQQRSEVASLYDMLSDAGVRTRRFLEPAEDQDGP